MQHVTWPHLVSLSLRLHASKAVLSQDVHFETLVFDPESKRSLNSLERYICARSPDESDQWAQPGSEAPLGECIEKVRIDLNSNYQDRCHESKLADVLHKTLMSALAVGGCAHCPSAIEAGSSHKCQWNKRTEQQDCDTLHASGNCLQPIKDLFSFCNAIASNAYRDHANRNFTDGWLALSTGHMHSRDDFTGIAIRGLTYENDAKLNATRVVRVSFDVNTFWFHDYLSLPYLLIHECVAHGYCGVSNIGAPESEHSKSFHDGWMDAVALYVLNLGLYVESDNQTDDAFRQHANSLMEQSNRVHTRRYDLDHKAAPADVIDWHRGVLALRTFAWLVFLALTDLGECDAQDDPIVMKHVLSMSLSLNASPLSHLDRGNLVNVLTTHYCRNSDTARTRALMQNPSAVEHLKAYFGDHQDIKKLVESLLTIPI